MICSPLPDVMTVPAHSLSCLPAVVLLLFASGCSEQGVSPEREIPTAQAERRDIREEIRLSGDVAPAFQVELKPEVGGKLREVHASTGQMVKQGELLFVIDDSDLHIERSSAQVEIDGARVSVEKLAGNPLTGPRKPTAVLLGILLLRGLREPQRATQPALTSAFRTVRQPVAAQGASFLGSGG